MREARRLSADGELKINLGCGPNIKPGWVNIDLWQPGGLHLDIREPLPFHDNSASLIYSEHVFEHLSYPAEAQRLLRESYRVLKAGGIFSVGVPDTEFALRSYVNAEEEFFAVSHKMGWHPAWCNTRMHQINYHFRQGAEHQYAYDYETLAQVLHEAGFSGIHQRPFDPSLDAEYRRWGTIYVDAEKPHISS
jgi:predicted SAM-dependent methyltransferase